MQKNFLDPSKTLVIADFDGTFTKKEINGQKVTSLMNILMNEKYLGRAGVEAGRALYEKYYPIEIDPLLDKNTKNALMQEWWEASFAVLHDSKVTKQMLLEVCNSPLMQWRDDFLDFARFLIANDVPLVVFSAGGFGQLAIEYLLEKEGLLADNVKILSNQLVFDERGYFSHPVPPIIHTVNKKGETLVANGLLAKLPSRPHCLLIGDSIDDANMANGIEFSSIYRVAFASHSQEHFEQAFDLVLPVDGGYGQILGLFDAGKV